MQSVSSSLSPTNTFFSGTLLTARVQNRYNPSVRLRYVTEELAFETDEEAAKFILEYAERDVLDDSQPDYVKLLTKKTRVFEEAKAAAFSRVDIKGQI